MVDLQPVAGAADRNIASDAAIDGSPWSRRKPPIGRFERRSLDSNCASRIERLGGKPWLDKQTKLVGVTVDLEFDLLPLRESWLFSTSAKKRAARFVAEFCAFQQHTNTANFRGYVLRPPEGKAQPGKLGEALKSLNKQYDRAVHRAKMNGHARPIACFLHIRFDVELRVWDLHLHCIFDVEPAHADDFLIKLAVTFATTKANEDNGNIGAWCNYSCGWAVNHRELDRWPDEAIMEFHGLKAPRLFRKAGEFKDFSRTLKGKKHQWSNGTVTFMDRTPHKKVSGHAQDGRSASGVVAYQNIRIDGQMERFAVVKVDRIQNEESDVVRASSTDEPRARVEESTVSTGPIPPSPIQSSNNQRLIKLTELSRRELRRVAMWCRIWPCGHSKAVQPSSFGRAKQRISRSVERRVRHRLKSFPGP